MKQDISKIELRGLENPAFDFSLLRKRFQTTKNNERLKKQHEDFVHKEHLEKKKN